jgi:Tol biopolymer transport system component
VAAALAGCTDDSDESGAGCPAFVSGSGARLTLLDRDLEVVRQLGPTRRRTGGATHPAALAPAASSDGEVVAYAHVNGFLADGGVSTSQPPGSGYAYSTSIHVISGGDDRRVSQGVLDDSPELAPDGGQVVFRRGMAIDEHGAGVFVADVATGAAMPIATASPETGWSVGEWSPAGDRIALLRQRLQEVAPVDLVVVRPDGTVVSERAVQGIRDAPSWSPDGRRMASSVAPLDAAGRSEVVVHDPATGSMEPVAGTRSDNTFVLGWGGDGLRYVSDGRTWLLSEDGERRQVLGRKATAERLRAPVQVDAIVSARC